MNTKNFEFDGTGRTLDPSTQKCNQLIFNKSISLKPIKADLPT